MWRWQVAIKLNRIAAVFPPLPEPQNSQFLRPDGHAAQGVRSLSGEPQRSEERVEEAGVRALPRVRYGNREYFVDERLREFRSVSYLPQTIEFVPFDSVKGRRIRGARMFERFAPPHANPPT